MSYISFDQSKEFDLLLLEESLLILILLITIKSKKNLNH